MSAHSRTQQARTLMAGHPIRFEFYPASDRDALPVLVGDKLRLMTRNLLDNLPPHLDDTVLEVTVRLRPRVTVPAYTDDESVTTDA